MPVARTAQALKDLFGLHVVTGTVQHSIDQAAQLLVPAVEQIRQALRGQPVVHFDESCMRVGRESRWLHVASTHALSWYGAHRKRGSEALDSFGILPGFRESRSMTAGGRMPAMSVSMRCAMLIICANWCLSWSPRSNAGPSR
ncbi:transposase [Paraburkholderia sp. PGU19]|uniref:IS66 family transposase n=1 Tax=Paraburkholderia sp. PGU19 TaxID=2735434 RepID=UPI00237A6E82|nr:transposase [Paraburkholderia sp. PGU19]